MFLRGKCGKRKKKTKRNKGRERKQKNQSMEKRYQNALGSLGERKLMWNDMCVLPYRLLRVCQTTFFFLRLPACHSFQCVCLFADVTGDCMRLQFSFQMDFIIINRMRPSCWCCWFIAQTHVQTFGAKSYCTNCKQIWDKSQIVGADEALEL